MKHSFEQLERRWIGLIEQIGDASAAPEFFGVVQACYAHPKRWYHTLDHVADCLARLDEFEEFGDYLDIIEYAIWFHDAIYDPRRKTNEIRSAELANLLRVPLGIHRDVGEFAQDLILATMHDGQRLDEDLGLMVDIDLSILGAPTRKYDAYAKAIRREYAFADDKAYADGRKTFLRGMLKRRRIFNLEPFVERY